MLVPLLFPVRKKSPLPPRRIWIMGEKAAAPSSMNEEDWRGTFLFCHDAYNLVVRGSRTADDSLPIRKRPRIIALIGLHNNKEHT